MNHTTLYTHKQVYLMVSICFLYLLFTSCRQNPNWGDRMEQQSIAKVDRMPNMPHPYKMLDWEAKAKAFDAFVFDWNNPSTLGNLIWLDTNRRNINQPTFGLYTALKDVRQGPKANKGEFHESLNSLAALLGAGLVGIDKTNQHGYNYVKMVQNYFNSDNGWMIMMNNTTPSVGMLGGGYGRDWWYDVFPNALYYALCDVFPTVEGANAIQRSIADRFVKADSVLNGNYNYSFFDYGQMKGMVNHIPLQQDAAGGHAYVLLSAYRKFGDDRYLTHAKQATAALNNQTESRFYEILLPLGIYVAAYLNAAEGTNYDLAKMLDWTFEGCKNPEARNGWGIIEGSWGPYQVNGLQGSLIDGGGYAFLMNSIKPAWPLVPMVKYQPQYARAIGKWMLNNANACRLFYPMEIDDRHQFAPELKQLSHNLIAYEGLRRTDLYHQERLNGVEPVALGDGPLWAKGNPTESMFSLYSSSPVGIMGAIVRTSNVEGVLQLNCNVTDFYAERPYPVYLYYNPHDTSRQIDISLGQRSDLFDIVSKKYIAKDVDGVAFFELPADEARVVTILPAGTSLSKQGKQIIADGRHILTYY